MRCLLPTALGVRQHPRAHLWQYCVMNDVSLPSVQQRVMGFRERAFVPCQQREAIPSCVLRLCLMPLSLVLR